MSAAALSPADEGHRRLSPDCKSPRGPSLASSVASEPCRNISVGAVPKGSDSRSDEESKPGDCGGDDTCGPGEHRLGALPSDCGDQESSLGTASVFLALTRARKCLWRGLARAARRGAVRSSSRPGRDARPRLAAPGFPGRRSTGCWCSSQRRFRKEPPVVGREL
jgi:hypothetical protein